MAFSAKKQFAPYYKNMTDDDKKEAHIKQKKKEKEILVVKLD